MATKIDQLRAKRLDLLNKAEALTNAATDENPLTDEQATEAEGYLTEAETLKGEIEKEAERASKAADLHAKITAAKSAPDNPQIRKILNMGGLASGVHVGQDTAKVYALPRGVRRQPVQNFSATDDGMDPVVRAYRFGMWAMAMIGKVLPQYHNSRVEAYVRDNGLFNAAHGEGGSDTTGAHVLVPDEFSTDLILLREQYGVARRSLMNEPMSSDTKTVPRQTGNLTAYFVSENSAITESTMSFDNVTLVAKKLGVLARMSNELNADSAISIGDRLLADIAWAFANKEDECAFNGDGTSTYGHMTGVRTQLGTLTAGTAPGLIAGAGNSWSALTLLNFESVIGGLPQFADTPRTAWYCHRTFAYNVMQKLALASGGVTSQEIFNGNRVMMFLGYPVVMSQVFPSTTASGQIPVIFGDLSMGGKFGNRGLETISFSDQATVGGESMWERDQIGVRGTERFDVVIHDFGTNSVAGPICGLRTT